MKKVIGKIIGTFIVTNMLMPFNVSAGGMTPTADKRVSAIEAKLRALEDRIVVLEEENAILKNQNNELMNMLTQIADNTLGDINGDNIIDGRDATLLLTYYAKTSTDYNGTLGDFIVDCN